MERVDGLLEVRECPHGRGVYAVRDLAGDELLWSFQDVSVTTTPKSPPWKRWAMIVGRGPAGEPLFWDEADEGDEYWSNFLDHSDRPNVEFRISLEERRARLVTTRGVKAGEELFLDYRAYDPGNWAPDGRRDPHRRGK